MDEAEGGGDRGGHGNQRLRLRRSRLTLANFARAGSGFRGNPLPAFVFLNMRIVVLGAAAGGGFPQWNCACANCARARRGDAAARPSTQCSLAVSANGEDWVLLNAAPDLREQIAATPALHPREGERGSPIKAIALAGGETDAIAGLLHLRESQKLALYGSRRVLTLIAANPIFRVLDPAFVVRREIMLGRKETLGDFAGRSLGLAIEAFAVPGKVALYAEEEGEADLGTAEGGHGRTRGERREGRMLSLRARLRRALGGAARPPARRAPRVLRRHALDG